VQLGWDGLHAGERLFSPLPEATEGIIPQAIPYSRFSAIGPA
jgi:hypothetical protein